MNSRSAWAVMYLRPAILTVFNQPRFSHRQAVTGEAPVTPRNLPIEIGGAASGGVSSFKSGRVVSFMLKRGTRFNLLAGCTSERARN